MDTKLSQRACELIRSAADRVVQYRAQLVYGTESDTSEGTLDRLLDELLAAAEIRRTLIDVEAQTHGFAGGMMLADDVILCVAAETIFSTKDRLLDELRDVNATHPPDAIAQDLAAVAEVFAAYRDLGGFRAGTEGTA